MWHFLKYVQITYLDKKFLNVKTRPSLIRLDISFFNTVDSLSLLYALLDQIFVKSFFIQL